MMSVSPGVEGRAPGRGREAFGPAQAAGRVPGSTAPAREVAAAGPQRREGAHPG